MEDKFEKRKLILRIGALLFILLFVILTIVVVNNILRNNRGENVAPQSGVEEELRIVFDGADGLDKMMGASMANILLNDVQTVIMMPDEMELVGDSDMELRAFVDSSGLIEGTYFPYTTFSMFFGTSDGRYYLTHMAKNSEKYCGVLVQRTLVQETPSYGQPYLYVTIVDDDGLSQDSIIEDLMNWAKTIYPGGYMITTTKV